jgi:hypothetical protein
MAFSFLSEIGLIAWNDNVSFTTVMQRKTKKAPRQFQNWNPDITKKLNLYFEILLCVDSSTRMTQYQSNCSILF